MYMHIYIIIHDIYIYIYMYIYIYIIIHDICVYIYIDMNTISDTNANMFQFCWLLPICAIRIPPNHPRPGIGTNHVE